MGKITKVIIGKPKTIKIDRTKSSDPKSVNDGLTIVKDETDTRSMTLTKVDLTKIRFETMLKEGETFVTGEERLKRLKKRGHTRLDARIVQTLIENKHLIPESWKKKVNGDIRYIYFDGTVFRDPIDRRGILCLYWSGRSWSRSYGWHDGWWFLGFKFLSHNLGANCPSAVLAQ